AVAVAALAAPCATACLSTPPFEPVGALSYADDGNGGTITALDAKLHFASGPGFHLPDALTIDGTNVFGHNAGEICFAPDEVGLAIAPTPRISAHGTGAATMNQLTPTLRGPAAVQLQLDWSSQFTCSNNRPAGRSTYTMFPDGRIVRHDTLMDARPDMSTSANACACDPSGAGHGVTVSEFWTFATAPFHTILIPEDLPDPQQLPTGGAPALSRDSFYTACLDAGNYRVAFAQHTTADNVILGRPKIVATSSEITFSREKDVGQSMIDPLDWETSDAVFVERRDCNAAIKRAREHWMPSQLTVNGAPHPLSLIDGIYGGDGGDGPGIAIGEHATISGTVNSSFAVWLTFDTRHDIIHATMPGQTPEKTGAWYALQRVPGTTSWILWFRDPIETGQMIDVVPVAPP
ncbi:MAG TPA: hypothetical protein VIX73_20350, partial [Kofleriaceae bacterium]